MAFLRAVLADAAARAPIDPLRALLGGFSGGGMMAWRVACDAPGAFRAYLPVAGLLWRPLPEACAGPAPMLHVHGWSDPVVPLEGRSVAGGRITQGDLFAAAPEWGLEAVMEPLTPDDLHAAEAAWIVSSVRHVTPIRAVDGVERPIDASLSAAWNGYLHARLS